MGKYKIFTILFLSLFFISEAVWADCRGCCSHHGGVTCVDGVTRCGDGTALSAKCRAKGCSKCFGSSSETGSNKPSTSVSTPASQPVSSVKSKTGVKKGNTWNDSFNKAKKTLERQIYADHLVTFYCGCPFDAVKNVLPCDNFKSKSGNKRARRVEWEHIVPAAHFGQSFKEWRDGDSQQCIDSKGNAFKGRKCAEKVNFLYRYMQADMYNLVPAIGEINGLRSNYRYDMVAGEDREFGACDFEISGNVAEPPERVRGDIARTYFYMESAYSGRGVMSRANLKLYKAWDKQDPVDKWECERCKRIEAIQGNENTVVKGACQEAGLW